MSERLSSIVRSISWARVAGRALAIAALVAAVLLLGTTYFGHSSSPYGVCYGRSGRAIPCAALKP